MSMLRLFRRRGSAPVARERLQVLLAHERAFVSQPDLINDLREGILAVIAKHVEVRPEQVQVQMNCGDAISSLQVDIEIPISSDRPLEARIC